MDVFIENQGFLHIGELIFTYLDPKTLLKCRLVKKSWISLIESQKSFWLPILKNWLETKGQFYSRWTLWREITQRFLHKNREEVEVFGKHMNSYFATQVSPYLESPMHFAIVQGNLEFINYLKVFSEVLEEKDSGGKNAIMLACIKNQEEIVLALLPMMLDYKIPSVDYFGKSAIMFAVERGYENITKILLAANYMDWYQVTNHGKNLLHLAVETNNVKIVKIVFESLIESNKEYLVNSKNTKSGQTVLHVAVQNRSEEIVTLLVNCKRIDVDIADNYGRTPFLDACINRSKKMVKMLAKFSDVNTKDTKTKVVKATYGLGMTPLLWASSIGHSKVVKILLKQDNIAINESDVQGRTAFIYACMKGHVKIVRALLNQPTINVKQLDFEKISALTYAIKNEHFDIANLLLKSNKCGEILTSPEPDKRLILMFTIDNNFAKETDTIITSISTHCRLEDGKTYFTWACENGLHKAIEALLAKDDSKCSLKECDFERMTGLMYACKNGDLSLVKLLLKKHSENSLNSKDNFGRTAFLWAVEKGQTEVVKFFLEEMTLKIDMEDKDCSGHNALMLSCQKGHYDIMKILFPLSDCNATDYSKKTAFIHACINGNVKVVKYLIKHGKSSIDFDPQDLLGNTAFVYACQNGNSEIVELLIKKSTKRNIDISNHGALHKAAMNHHIKIINILAENKVLNLNYRDESSYTVFDHILYQWNSNSDLQCTKKNRIYCEKIFMTLKKLLSLWTLWNSKEEAYLWICHFGFDYFIENMFETNADINYNYQDEDGSTGLMYAAFNKRLKVVELILQNSEKMDIDLNLKDKGGRTAYKWAKLACDKVTLQFENHMKIMKKKRKAMTKLLESSPAKKIKI